MDPRAYFREQLQQRCRDLLLAERDFDRAVNQATLVLENRLREKLATDRSLYGKALVDDVMPEAFEQAKFKISASKNEYFGYKKIILGIFQAHRNPSHHGIQNMNRVDAARICAYIDMLLAAIERCRSAGKSRRYR
jgi:uncharacterized protein (TIGR02391 family)